MQNVNNENLLNLLCFSFVKSLLKIFKRLTRFHRRREEVPSYSCNTERATSKECRASILQKFNGLSARCAKIQLILILILIYIYLYIYIYIYYSELSGICVLEVSFRLMASRSGRNLLIQSKLNDETVFIVRCFC